MVDSVQAAAPPFNLTIDLTDVHQRPAWLEREWLLSNGSGGYAMGTVGGTNTRRYHGLLVAATQPPVGRIIALSQTLEQLQLRPVSDASQAVKDLGPRMLEFSSCRFRSHHDGQAVHSPAGVERLIRFEKSLAVTWTYRQVLSRDVTITFHRTLHLHDNEQAATLRYRVQGLPDGVEASLRVRPMLTLRDFHAMLDGHQAQAQDPFEVTPDTSDPGLLRVKRAGNAVTLRATGADGAKASFEPDASWWWRLWYPADTERGQEDFEDLYVPGAFHQPLAGQGDHELALTVCLGDQPADARDSDQPRTQRLTEHAQTLGQTLKVNPKSLDPLHHALVQAADDFVVERTVAGKRLSTILAGYPWFADWGRDTFIALPGLMLTTGRYAEARAVLEAFAGSIRRGLTPNRFDDYDQGEAHYNTVDASLWFVKAADAYLTASGDTTAWEGFLGKACRAIVDGYAGGTDNDIFMTDDGLIAAGGPDTQLTWMDAACGDVVFTPRQGMAVEINGLWMHALSVLADRIEPSDPAAASRYRDMLGRARKAFTEVFWSHEAGYLIDHVVIGEDGRRHPAATLRPNQCIALAIPDCPLPDNQRQMALEAVQENLLTPMGLRTLPEGDPNYHPQYRGPQFERDKAYHQGTVWPWLIGPYAEAVLRAGGFSGKAKAQARAAIAPLLHRLTHEGLGQLHEIHEALPPHRPVGCIAQAWSVAEPMRILALIASS